MNTNSNYSGSNCTPISVKDVCYKFQATEWTDVGSDYIVSAGSILTGELANNIETLNVTWDASSAVGTPLGTANGFSLDATQAAYLSTLTRENTITFDRPINGNLELSVSGVPWDTTELMVSLSDFSVGSPVYVGAADGSVGGVIKATDGNSLAGTITLSNLEDVSEIKYKVNSYRAGGSTATDWNVTLGINSITPGEFYTVEWERHTDCNGVIYYIDENGAITDTVPATHTQVTCPDKFTVSVRDACVETSFNTISMLVPFNAAFPVLGGIRVGNNFYQPPVEWPWTVEGVRSWGAWVASHVGGFAGINISGNNTQPQNITLSLILSNIPSNEITLSTYYQVTTGNTGLQFGPEVQSISVTATPSSSTEDLLMLMPINGCEIGEICYKTLFGEVITVADNETISSCTEKDILQALLDCICCDIYSSAYSVSAIVGGMWL
jgi:hypothetical protein